MNKNSIAVTLPLQPLMTNIDTMKAKATRRLSLKPKMQQQQKQRKKTVIVPHPTPKAPRRSSTTSGGSRVQRTPIPLLSMSPQEEATIIKRVSRRVLPAGESLQGANFATKLYILLELADELDCNDIISWDHDGTCFEVKNRGMLLSFLPKCDFTMSQWDSFLRQLNFYGFKRVSQGRSRGAYFHPCFERGCIDQLSSIVTNRSSNKKKKCRPRKLKLLKHDDDDDDVSVASIKDDDMSEDAPTKAITKKVCGGSRGKVLIIGGKKKTVAGIPSSQQSKDKRPVKRASAKMKPTKKSSSEAKVASSVGGKSKGTDLLQALVSSAAAVTTMDDFSPSAKAKADSDVQSSTAGMMDEEAITPLMLMKEPQYTDPPPLRPSTTSSSSNITAIAREVDAMFEGYLFTPEPTERPKTCFDFDFGGNDDDDDDTNNAFDDSMDPIPLVAPRRVSNVSGGWPSGLAEEQDEDGSSVQMTPAGNGMAVGADPFAPNKQWKRGVSPNFEGNGTEEFITPQAERFFDEPLPVREVVTPEQPLAKAACPSQASTAALEDKSYGMAPSTLVPSLVSGVSSEWITVPNLPTAFSRDWTMTTSMAAGVPSLLPSRTLSGESPSLIQILMSETNKRNKSNTGMPSCVPPTLSHSVSDAFIWNKSATATPPPLSHSVSEGAVARIKTKKMTSNSSASFTPVQGTPSVWDKHVLSTATAGRRFAPSFSASSLNVLERAAFEKVVPFESRTAAPCAFGFGRSNKPALGASHPGDTALTVCFSEQSAVNDKPAPASLGASVVPLEDGSSYSNDQFAKDMQGVLGGGDFSSENLIDALLKERCGMRGVDEPVDLNRSFSVAWADQDPTFKDVISRHPGYALQMKAGLASSH